MAVKIVFLGKLADIAGESERTAEPPCDWQQIRAQWDAELVAALQSERVMVAINGQVLSNTASLTARDGDEVAFLPPVSGG